MDNNLFGRLLALFFGGIIPLAVHLRAQKRHDRIRKLQAIDELSGRGLVLIFFTYGTIAATFFLVLAALFIGDLIYRSMVKDAVSLTNQLPIIILLTSAGLLFFLCRERVLQQWEAGASNTTKKMPHKKP